MWRSINKIIIGLSLFIMVAAPIAATVYEGNILVSESNGTDYTMLPIIAAADVDGLATSGFISSTGLDTSISGISGQHMLVDDQIMFASGIDGNSSNTFVFSTDQTPISSYDIITGYGGYVTVADAAALEPGDNFEFETSGYIDTSVTGDIISKTDAFSLSTAAGDVTATIDVASSFPVVETTNTSTTSASATATVSLPASVAAGDLLIIALSYEAADTPTTPSGWTEIYEDPNYNRIGAVAYYKYADGTEGANVSVTFSGSTDSAHVAYRISGAESAPEYEYTNGADVTSANPNPPSLTPSWGADNTLWLALSHNTNFSASSYPSGYSDGITADSGSEAISMAGKQENTATEDPGTFTIPDPVYWLASTIGVKPVSNAVSVTDTVTVGEHILKVTADGTNMKLYVDGVEVDSVALAGESITDNANNWVILGDNTMPYADYYKHTVSGTLIVHYQPADIISGTTLPDLEGTAQNGTFTFGSNPAGISVTLQSLKPNSAVSSVDTSTTGTSGLGNLGSGDMSSIDTRTSPGTFLDPVIEVFADATGFNEYLLWLALYTILILGAYAMSFKMLNSLVLAGASTILVSTLFVAIGVLDWYFILFGVIITGASAAIDSRQTI